jgi:hypothetical protein
LPLTLTHGGFSPTPRFTTMEGTGELDEAFRGVDRRSTEPAVMDFNS